jgi:hypothetical protein
MCRNFTCGTRQESGTLVVIKADQRNRALPKRARKWQAQDADFIGSG